MEDSKTSSPPIRRGGSRPGQSGQTLENIDKFGMKSIVAINRFATDTDEEIKLIHDYACARGFDSSGGGIPPGAEKAGWTSLTGGGYGGQGSRHYTGFTIGQPGGSKIHTIAQIWSGEGGLLRGRQADLKRIANSASTSCPSASQDPEVTFRQSRPHRPPPKTSWSPSADNHLRAGDTMPITGEIMRMPGLPKHPPAETISVEDDGDISSLFALTPKTCAGHWQAGSHIFGLIAKARIRGSLKVGRRNGGDVMAWWGGDDKDERG